MGRLTPRFLMALRSRDTTSFPSTLLHLNPFVQLTRMLCVGGRDRRGCSVGPHATACPKLCLKVRTINPQLKVGATNPHIKVRTTKPQLKVRATNSQLKVSTTQPVSQGQSHPTRSSSTGTDMALQSQPLPLITAIGICSGSHVPVYGHGHVSHRLPAAGRGT